MIDNLKGPGNKKFKELVNFYSKRRFSLNRSAMPGGVLPKNVNF